jgi:hypothetical protein
MEERDGTSKAQAPMQKAYEAVGASILNLEVREHVVKLRGLLRGIYRRPDPPPQISD